MAKKSFIINITEQSGWEHYDTSINDDIATWSLDSAWDSWKALDDNECRELIDDLIVRAFTKREQKKLSPSSHDRICEDLRDNGACTTLKTVYHAILDAMAWAWEIAYMPEERDIQYAIDTASEEWFSGIELIGYWRLIISEPAVGPREWSPRPQWTEDRIFKDLTERISYRHKQNHYDRFLEFDFLTAPSTAAMRMALLAHPDEGSIKNLEEELFDWTGNFISEFFKQLENRMEGVYVPYRYDFTPMWKQMLSDKAIIRGVRKELTAFLATPVEAEE